MLDFIRIACAVPEVKVGDVKKNASDICSFMEQADAQNAARLFFKAIGHVCTYGECKTVSRLLIESSVELLQSLQHCGGISRAATHTRRGGDVILKENLRSPLESPDLEIALRYPCAKV